MADNSLGELALDSELSRPRPAILLKTSIALVLLAATTTLSSGTTFTVTTTNDAGAGSLRQAIGDANASPGLDSIIFNIPGAGPHSIQPLSPLPTITDPVVIDGYTQPGASPNTLSQGDNAVLVIELDGTSAGAGASGLTITSGGSTVSGLAINRFTANRPLQNRVILPELFFGHG